MPITAVIIIGLFAVQRHGTAMVGRFFGPVMILWFITIGTLVCGDRRAPGDPAGALTDVCAGLHDRALHIAFFALAAVVLSVTGAEALYADMGHFGRRSITLGWLALVCRRWCSTEFGQGVPARERAW